MLCMSKPFDLCRLVLKCRTDSGIALKATVSQPWNIMAVYKERDRLALPCLYRPLQAELPVCFKTSGEQLIRATRYLITSTLSPHINVV